MPVCRHRVRAHIATSGEFRVTAEARLRVKNELCSPDSAGPGGVRIENIPNYDDRISSAKVVSRAVISMCETMTASQTPDPRPLKKLCKMQRWRLSCEMGILASES